MFMFVLISNRFETGIQGLYHTKGTMLESKVQCWNQQTAALEISTQTFFAFSSTSSLGRIPGFFFGPSISSGIEVKLRDHMNKYT